LHQGLRISRPGLALVLALFCVPLFVGLDREDIRDDEAIYSFAVDRILETGDWLEPKSIPNEDWAFLEKPPLKFWIVAAPIRLGLLPHNEFGIRFWDALFGALAFVYVFLIGSRMLGPVCGLVAVLVLFVHEPLVFSHGLRTNNMDAPVVVAYCGGVYHFLAWTTAAARRAAWGQAIAVVLYFVLGFMTKFAAVFFLPVVLGAAVLLVPEYRRRLLRDWRLWAVGGGVAAALIAPWFLWAWRRYGAFFWETIFGAAVYTRMTLYLDPSHLQPWHFYVVSLYEWTARSGSLLLVAAGLAVLVWQTVRRRWAEGIVVLSWLVLPVLAISAGTSKLYHYLYPFVPPLALAAGYVAALALLLAPAPFGRVVIRVQAYAAERWGRSVWLVRRPLVRRALLAVASVAVMIAVVTLVRGPILITVDSTEVFKSSGILRPLVVAVACGMLAGVGSRAAQVIVAVLVLSTMPLPAYRAALDRLTKANSPLRDTRDCILAVQARTPGIAPGMYVDVPPDRLPHPYYYYFRTIRPWVRAGAPAPDALGPYLDDPRHRRPLLVWEPTYQEYRRTIASSAAVHGRVSPPMRVVPQVVDDVLVVLPGPYGACSADRPAPQNSLG
jgi:4-amino-4-deoxy-L-arabinose transferase-like glycosyltransferase